MLRGGYDRVYVGRFIVVEVENGVIGTRLVRSHAQVPYLVVHQPSNLPVIRYRLTDVYISFDL